MSSGESLLRGKGRHSGSPLDFSHPRDFLPHWTSISIPRCIPQLIFAAQSHCRCGICRVRNWRKISARTSQRLLEMYVRPSIRYVCFCFFCGPLAFSLFLLFNAGVFCFSPFFIMNARWVTIWLRLVFCAICFYYVGKHT